MENRTGCGKHITKTETLNVKVIIKTECGMDYGNPMMKTGILWKKLILETGKKVYENSMIKMEILREKLIYK